MRARGPSATRSSVSRAGVEHARAQQHDVVIVDTAGRLAVDANLMQQAADIRTAIRPDEVLFVIDAMIGQAAVETALAFHEGVAFTGVVLSKLDGDARGGAALSVAEITGEPIMFASTGEKVTDIEVFHPDRMASRILDMGDVLTLIEQAEKAFDKRQADEMARKFLAEEDFTFEDFLQQMNAIKKMGSLKSMLKMMPGMQGMREQLDAFDDREFDRVEAMVRSMTPFERTHPKQINGSRRARIAKGSGVTVTEVNQLLVRFGDAQKMMKSLARGGGGGLPGMPGVPGTGKRGRPQQPQRKKSKSGNPAKRAAEERAAAEKAASGRSAAAASAFGVPGAAEGADPMAASTVEPPEGLEVPRQELRLRRVDPGQPARRGHLHRTRRRNGCLRFTVGGRYGAASVVCVLGMAACGPGGGAVRCSRSSGLVTTQGRSSRRRQGSDCCRVSVAPLRQTTFPQ